MTISYHTYFSEMENKKTKVSTVFENYSNVAFFEFLNFSIDFCPIKSDLSGNTLIGFCNPKCCKMRLFVIFKHCDFFSKQTFPSSD